MICREADIDVMEKDGVLIFHSKQVDLGCESLVVPAQLQDIVGTVEFFRDKVVLHPANGKDVEITPAEFVDLFGTGEIV